MFITFQNSGIDISIFYPPCQNEKIEKMNVYTHSPGMEDG